MRVSRKGWAALAAMTTVLGLVTGCGVRESAAPVQRSLNYELLTHCGIHWARFDGRYWITPFLGERRTHSAPEGWDDPLQQGEMRLTSENRAVFTSAGHPPLSFRATQGRPSDGCD